MTHVSFLYRSKMPHPNESKARGGLTKKLGKPFTVNCLAKNKGELKAI